MKDFYFRAKLPPPAEAQNAKEYYLKYPNLNRYYSGLLTQSEGIILEYEYYGTDTSTTWTGSKTLSWNNTFQYDNITFDIDEFVEEYNKSKNSQKEYFNNLRPI